MFLLQGIQWDFTEFFYLQQEGQTWGCRLEHVENLRSQFYIMNSVKNPTFFVKGVRRGGGTWALIYDGINLLVTAPIKICYTVQNPVCCWVVLPFSPKKWISLPEKHFSFFNPLQRKRTSVPNSRWLGNKIEAKRAVIKVLFSLFMISDTCLFWMLFLVCCQTWNISLWNIGKNVGESQEKKQYFGPD